MNGSKYDRMSKTLFSFEIVQTLLVFENSFETQRIRILIRIISKMKKNISLNNRYNNVGLRIICQKYL